MNSKYFNLEQDKMLSCPCCGRHPLKGRLMETLDTIRDQIKEPVIIVSGYRCPDYNDTLKGSVKNSGHTTGEAADIRVKGWSNNQLYNFIKALYYVRKCLPHLCYCYKIKGTTNTSVHIGVDDKPRKNIFG